jgi:hypothetical protein
MQIHPLVEQRFQRWDRDIERIIGVEESILHPVVTSGAIAVCRKKRVELIEGPGRQKPSHGELVNRLDRIA